MKCWHPPPEFEYAAPNMPDMNALPDNLQWQREHCSVLATQKAPVSANNRWVLEQIACTIYKLYLAASHISRSQNILYEICLYCLSSCTFSTCTSAHRELCKSGFILVLIVARELLLIILMFETYLYSLLCSLKHWQWHWQCEKCLQCTFLHVTIMLKINVSLCCNLMVLLVKFSISSSNNAVLMLSLGTVTKEALWGFGKCLGFQYRHKYGLRLCPRSP